jgi:DNA-binding response OmpR family regulator
VKCTRPRLSTPARRILVVDDDEEVRSGLRCVLTAEGFQADTAGDGLAAIAACREHAFDLALVDMNMPKQNGWGTIASLRGLDPTLPIIIITARPDQQTVAREAGVELMEKPLDLPTLLRRIDELTQI